ncbi:MAG: type I glyceraldehyde-3-phosphate dehydrogenase, partial [Bacteroidales bacterium]|nr:type I glyceraldehyde-3-phosphate dehydrogenase [Bacteroidales bacterium]
MSKIRVAINGFGRIGRITLRRLVLNKKMEVVAINDLTDTPTLAHLLKYDSVHRQFPGTVENNGDHIIVNGDPIRVYSIEDPGRLPWRELDIDVVIESTGQFVNREQAIRHVEESGARKVIISAPAKGERADVKYVVLGVNDHIIDKNEVIISNSSCTTNNVAPLIM